MEAEAANNVEKDSAAGGKNKRKRKSAANNTKEPPQVCILIISILLHCKHTLSLSTTGQGDDRDTAVRRPHAAAHAAPSAARPPAAAQTLAAPATPKPATHTGNVILGSTARWQPIAIVCGK